MVLFEVLMMMIDSGLFLSILTSSPTKFWSSTESLGPSARFTRDAMFCCRLGGINSNRKCYVSLLTRVQTKVGNIQLFISLPGSSILSYGIEANRTEKRS